MYRQYTDTSIIEKETLYLVSANGKEADYILLIDTVATIGGEDGLPE